MTSKLLKWPSVMVWSQDEEMHFSVQGHGFPLKKNDQMEREIYIFPYRFLESLHH